MSEAAADSASDFAASSDEEGSQQGWTPRQAFVICDAFPTFEEAIIGIDVLDGCHYKYKHNYGNAGNGTRIYSCKSHADSPKRLRLSKFQAEKDGSSSFQYVLEETAEHAAERQDVPRRGIHRSLKREVDSIRFGAPCPGITPSQNAFEAHHRVIKQVYVGSLRASPADVLNDSIPRIIGLQEGEPTRQMLNHYAEGRWVSAAVARAQTLVQEKDNYSVIKGMRAKFVKPILFNASKFIVSPKNIYSAGLTVFARQSIGTPLMAS
ncbi:hypothetical protein PI126_g11620 [Phytophthora idaei]|nr:hypothetical protein PI126_g11620 [Phytophthora idaei]